MVMTGLDQALARSQAFIRKRRLSQREGRKAGGKALADALGSLGPDIDGPEGVPAEWGLPLWFLECVSTLFHRQTKADALAWWMRAADGEEPLLKRASALPDEAWWAMNDAFKIACVRDAIARAEPVCRDMDYWPQVTAAAQQVCGALEGKGDVEAAYAGAEAVRNAASETAWSACAAGRASDAHAAYASVFAAEAAIWAAEAAWAADDARGAADAVVAAANAEWCAGGARYIRAGSASAVSATYKALANKLLSLIEVECATGGHSKPLVSALGCVDDTRPGLRVFRDDHPGTEEETEDDDFDEEEFDPAVVQDNEARKNIWLAEEAQHKRRVFWGVSWGSIIIWVALLSLFSSASALVLWYDFQYGSFDLTEDWLAVGHLTVHVVAIAGLLAYGVIKTFVIMLHPELKLPELPELPDNRSAKEKAKERAYNWAWVIGVSMFTMGAAQVLEYLGLIGGGQRPMPLVPAILLMVLGAAILIFARLRFGSDSSHARPNVAGAEAERMLINRYLASRK